MTCILIPRCKSKSTTNFLILLLSFPFYLLIFSLGRGSWSVHPKSKSKLDFPILAGKLSNVNSKFWEVDLQMFFVQFRTSAKYPIQNIRNFTLSLNLRHILTQFSPFLANNEFDLLGCLLCYFNIVELPNIGTYMYIGWDLLMFWAKPMRKFTRKQRNPQSSWVRTRKKKKEKKKSIWTIDVQRSREKGRSQELCSLVSLPIFSTLLPLWAAWERESTKRRLVVVYCDKIQAAASM